MSSIFPSSRESAFARLSDFHAGLKRYDKERNKVIPHHENVSRLSPAIRHRLVSEKEVAEWALEEYDFRTVEKFVQEVYWRRYWKGWLAMRPFVWDQYLGDLKHMSPSPEAEAVMRGEGEVEIMNHWVRELVETGYLHNHARMWFAAYWIHTLGLPWQLGADFFYKHLLDADPASNTLSWRWVAGLQTQGKTYIARRSNILKFTHHEVMKGRETGLSLLDEEREIIPDEETFRRENGDWNEPNFPEPRIDSAAPVGMWIHEEDLSADIPFYEDFQPSCFLLTKDEKTAKGLPYSAVKDEWTKAALKSTRESLEKDSEVTYVETENLGQALLDWAQEKGLSQIIACRPDIGYLEDQIPAIREILSSGKVRLEFIERPEDVTLRPYARAGFFGFWKKLQRMF